MIRGYCPRRAAALRDLSAVRFRFRGGSHAQQLGLGTALPYDWLAQQLRADLCPYLPLGLLAEPSMRRRTAA